MIAPGTRLGGRGEQAGSGAGEVDLDAAQAQMDSLDAQVSEQQVQLHYYKVVAPRGGIVGDVPVHVGDRVTTATQLTTVDQPGSLEAYVYVPIERSAQLKMNMPVQVLDSDGKVLAQSRISFISPQVDNTTQTVLVKARIANGNDALRQSQFIRARVVWGTHRTRRCRSSRFRDWVGSILHLWRNRRTAARSWPGKNH